MLGSLLAGTDPAKNDEVGKEILTRCNAGLNRKADVQTPVDKGDFAELLRRRMFQKFPKGAAECDKYVTAFWHRMERVDPARAKIPASRKDLMDAYPFHPDLLSRLFGKWGGLRQFQRTRGILQTFSSALRDAEAWDDSPLIGAQVFLAKPGATDPLGAALDKMANSAMESAEEQTKPDWPSNLRTELPRSAAAQRSTTLVGREIEAACVASFIYSQPIGEQAELGELKWLLGATVELPAMLNTGLLEWAKSSWYLCECESTDPASGVPRYWRIGPKPNLNQMHDTYKRSALKNARAKFDDLVKDMYGAFGRHPDLPKLLSTQTVVNTIEDAVQRGLLALRYIRPTGGEEWFWRCPIEGLVEWAECSEVWLPAKATVKEVHASAVRPDALPGLWPADNTQVKLSDVCAWFDGAHEFDEEIQPGYPPEKRPIPKADYKLVHQAVAKAVERSDVWLLFGNDSVLGELPTPIQLDADASLSRPPEALRTVDIMPGALPSAWTGSPPKATVGNVYAELKSQKGLACLTDHSMLLTRIVLAWQTVHEGARYGAEPPRRSPGPRAAAGGDGQLRPDRSRAA